MERGRRVQRKVPRLLTHLESLQVEKQHLQTRVMIQQSRNKEVRFNLRFRGLTGGACLTRRLLTASTSLLHLLHLSESLTSEQLCFWIFWEKVLVFVVIIENDGLGEGLKCTFHAVDAANL